MRDSLHIELLSKQIAEYSKANIKNVISLMQNMKSGRKVNQHNMVFQFLYAGHIPGSASILLDYHGYRILYTGDVNNCETRLLAGSSYNVKDVDVMLCESTYGNREHQSRTQEENNFLDEVKNTLKRGGSVLIPAFAVGRAQAIAILLSKRKWNVPIYMDGMAKKITRIIQRYPESIKNSYELEQALERITIIQNPRHRMQALESQGIFLTTSGMLDGGPVLEYLKHFYFNEKNSLLMTGYQVEGSGGRHLLDTGKIFIDGNMLKVKCLVKKFDFSAHSGKKELVSLINRIKPRNLILEHGDPDSIEIMSNSVSHDMNIFTPTTGETIVIK